MPWMNPKKPGEVLRICVDCKGGFEPNSRNQIRCPECRAKKEKERNRRKKS